MISIQHVSKTFSPVGHRGADATAVHALNDINLEIADGDIFGIIGMSGAGKSTLVRTINLLERPTEGRIVVDGQDVTQLAGADLRAYRRRVAMIFQNFGLLAQKTVLANVCFPFLAAAGKVTEADRERALGLLERVGLKEKANAYPSQLSGGQQQRVGLARALAAEPRLMLLDEPFGAIDAITRGELQDELLRIHRGSGKTFVFVTHDISEAFKLGTKVLVIDRGRVQQYDTPDRIREQPATEFVRALLSSGAGGGAFCSVAGRDGI